MKCVKNGVCSASQKSDICWREREEILIIREIFPDPNCSQGSPVGLHCVVLLPRLTYSQAEADCGARKMRLWPGPDQDLSQVRTKSQIFSHLENVSRSVNIFSPQINDKIYSELDTKVWVAAETESLYDGTPETQTVTIAGKYQD